MQKKISITFAIGLIISIATLYLAFRNVPFVELVNYLLSINYFWIFPTAVLIIISFVLRAIRWQFILGSYQRVSFRHAFHPLMIGFMINCVLPGRVGEVARPVILKKKENVPFTTGLATVAAERVFDIAVETEIGVGIIEFRDLKPREPPKTYEVAIDIMTNIDKQYQVTQKVTSELVNKEGQVIPQEYFTLRTESVDTKGILKFAQNSPAKKGDTVLFISDRDGSPDSFKVIYELTCPADVKAGDYSTSVVYSLSEL